MQYGHFDEQNREYVITNPRTPVKWINYIGTLSFGGFVDHTGGMLICRNDPALNRITRYLALLPASDFKGSSLYLRLRQPGGKQRVFSAFYTPTLDPYDRYECHVGLGYTRIISEFYNLRTEATLFVPQGADCVMQDIRLTNLSDKPLSVDAVPVLEFTHPDSLKQLTNADWVPQTMVSKAVTDPQGRVVLVQYPFMLRDLRINYFTTNLPAASFETDRRIFLGDNEYGTWAHPLSLDQPELSSSQALRGDNIAALMHHLGELAPGETRQVITLLGQAANLAEAQPLIDRFRQPQAVDEALAQLAASWQSMLDRQQVDTPSTSMNQMLNVHNPRQVYITKQWSRYLSLYQLGYGERGIGVRDSSQDVMGVLANAPEEGAALLRLLMQVQKRNGSAMHQFNPLTMVGSTGESGGDEEVPNYYSDDHLWIVLAVAAYIKETGNFAFLDEVIPFYEKDKHEQPLESGTVLDHLQRAAAFTKGNTGRHGLPLLGFADWNDTVNLRAGAESLFTANLYGRALQELIVLSEHLDDPQSAQAYQQDYAAMCATVNNQAWDGQWYLRYFDADGTPLGSHKNDHGQIYLNGQSWAVISGFASPERSIQAMNAVYERLSTNKGIKLSAPGFNGFDPNKGGVTTYPPGAKENGGLFLHANTWAVIAEAMLGNGERAFEYYNQINPAARNDCIEEFECEPYVYPQNILGDEHPLFGLARNSWLTGTASWIYQAATQYILGIQPTYTGLKINPCIPKDWPGYTVTRFFRGAWYHIEVQNPQAIRQGVKFLSVDGQMIEGMEVPVFADGREHRVMVTMGN